MIERRNGLRLTKSIKGVITFEGKDYEATIIDISEKWIAFETNEKCLIPIGTSIEIGMEENIEPHKNLLDVFTGTIIGEIKNVKIYGNGKVRFGCFVDDEIYSEYVQAQLISYVCSSTQESA